MNQLISNFLIGIEKTNLNYEICILIEKLYQFMFSSTAKRYKNLKIKRNQKSCSQSERKDDLILIKKDEE